MACISSAKAGSLSLGSIINNVMVTGEKIEILVGAEINKREKLGFQRGGSGHMGHVSYRIDAIRLTECGKGITEIVFDYTLMVETEFTCYPDNPPYEYPASGVIRIDTDGKLVEG